MTYICFYWNLFPLSSNYFWATYWNLPIIHQPLNYGTDVQSFSAPCTVTLAMKRGNVESCVISIHVLTSPVFTFWFCTYRTLLKPHRPPHLGAAMESEYFLLSASVWEQKEGRWFCSSKGKGQVMGSVFWELQVYFKHVSCRNCSSGLQNLMGVRGSHWTKSDPRVSCPVWVGRKS